MVITAQVVAEELVLLDVVVVQAVVVHVLDPVQVVALAQVVDQDVQEDVQDAQETAIMHAVTVEELALLVVLEAALVIALAVLALAEIQAVQEFAQVVVA